METLPIIIAFVIGFAIGFGLRAVIDHFISAENDRSSSTFFEEATSIRAVTIFLLFIIGVAWLVTVIATFTNPDIEIAKFAPVHALMGSFVGFVIKQNKNSYNGKGYVKKAATKNKKR